MRVLDVSPPPDYTGAEHVATGLHGPAWEKTQVLVVGTLLARGRRTVAAALRHTDHADDEHFSLFHQILSRAHWSALELSRRLLRVILVAVLGPGRTVTVVIDETLERRWGRKITQPGRKTWTMLSRHARRRDAGLGVSKHVSKRKA